MLLGQCYCPFLRAIRAGVPRLSGSTMIPRMLTLAACAVGAAITMAAAQSTDFPRRGVTIVVPFPAGGTTDSVPRIIGAKLAERWRHPVIVENRPGAAGTTGSTTVANASPDGHTLLSSPAGPLVINRFVQKAFSFDPLQLTPITVM